MRLKISILTSVFLIFICSSCKNAADEPLDTAETLLVESVSTTESEATLANITSEITDLTEGEITTAVITTAEAILETTTTTSISTTASISTAEAVTSNSDTGGTPVSLYGKLSVKGTNIVDKNGKKFQLYGMSTHGIAWFPDYVNYDALKTLRDDWKTNCFRIALYTHEYGGYCNGGDKEALKKLVKNGVEYAKELGMYVIIDWHVLNEEDPNVYADEAVTFFTEMSELYADYDNVIYEICNEPNRSASWQSVKNYADKVIPSIRKNDSDAIIIVGTPTWSQDIDKAAENPLDYNNIMYALHFYAATHKEWLRERAENCIESGLPIIISEFGICDASGNGGNDIYEANQWMSLIEKYNLSYMCWNLSNKNESSAVIKSDNNKLYGWTADDLSESGQWILSVFRNETD